MQAFKRVLEWPVSIGGMEGLRPGQFIYLFKLAIKFCSLVLLIVSKHVENVFAIFFQKITIAAWGFASRPLLPPAAGVLPPVFHLLYLTLSCANFLCIQNLIYFLHKQIWTWAWSPLSNCPGCTPRYTLCTVWKKNVTVLPTLKNGSVITACAVSLFTQIGAVYTVCKSMNVQAHF